MLFSHALYLGRLTFNAVATCSCVKFLLFRKAVRRSPSDIKPDLSINVIKLFSNVLDDNIIIKYNQYIDRGGDIRWL